MRRCLVCFCLLLSGATVTGAKSAPPPPQPTVEPDWSVVRRESEAALKSALFDPGSAQITWTKGFGWGFYKPPLDRHYYGWVGCGLINAKNRMGGYVGNTPFVIVYDGGVKYDEMDEIAATACSNSTVAPQSALLDAPGVSNAVPSVADELTKLANLRDRGVITDAEFQAQKAKLLGTAPQ
jgi:hypothetical protein